MTLTGRVCDTLLLDAARRSSVASRLFGGVTSGSCARKAAHAERERHDREMRVWRDRGQSGRAPADKAQTPFASRGPEMQLTLDALLQLAESSEVVDGALLGLASCLCTRICMHARAVPRSRPDVESLERRRESSSLAPGLRSQSHDCLVWLQSTSGSPRSRESRHFVVGNGHGP